MCTALARPLPHAFPYISICQVIHAHRWLLWLCFMLSLSTGYVCTGLSWAGCSLFQYHVPCLCFLIADWSERHHSYCMHQCLRAMVAHAIIDMPSCMHSFRQYISPLLAGWPQPYALSYILVHAMPSIAGRLDHCHILLLYVSVPCVHALTIATCLSAYPPLWLGLVMTMAYNSIYSCHIHLHVQVEVVSGVSVTMLAGVSCCQPSFPNSGKRFLLA